MAAKVYFSIPYLIHYDLLFFLNMSDEDVTLNIIFICSVINIMRGENKEASVSAIQKSNNKFLKQ